MSKTVNVVAGIGLDQKNAEKPLAGAARCCAERERPLPRPVHVGPHGFRVDLISKDAMWWVTRMFEGQFVLGARYPGIV
jgi:hypothetical protein